MKEAEEDSRLVLATQILNKYDKNYSPVHFACTLGTDAPREHDEGYRATCLVDLRMLEHLTLYCQYSIYDRPTGRFVYSETFIFTDVQKLLPRMRERFMRLVLASWVILTELSEPSEHQRASKILHKFYMQSMRNIDENEQNTFTLDKTPGNPQSNCHWHKSSFYITKFMCTDAVLVLHTPRILTMLDKLGVKYTNALSQKLELVANVKIEI